MEQQKIWIEIVNSIRGQSIVGTTVKRLESEYDVYPKNSLDELKYWKERCLAAENVMKCSTLYQPLGSKKGSYQPEWYEAREIWQIIQKNEPCHIIKTI